MRRLIKLFQPCLILLLCLVFFVKAAGAEQAGLSLTAEERTYLAEAPVIQAVSLEGVAPLQYTGENGEVKGISRRVLEQISEMTGLVFEYRLYSELDKAFDSGADIVFGIPHPYVPEGMALSRPFLESETILYINSSCNADELEDKIYAAIRGSALPEGIREEQALYFDTREESLDAVESGKADYGYGNAYSVAFYTLQNNYKNIVTIPRGKEIRQYCIGLLEGDPLLLSVIDKAIGAMDENQLQTLILDVASHVDRQISLAMVMDSYGGPIIILALVIIGTLLLLLLSNLRVKKKLELQNRKHELLSHISNECLFEYTAAADRLLFSSSCVRLFKTTERLEEMRRIVKRSLSERNADDSTATIRLPLEDGESLIFRTVISEIYDSSGRLHSVIGKLVDITREEAEKEELLLRAQVDGLTGLFNAATIRERIIEQMNGGKHRQTAALLILDCDKFKELNDNFGHLFGDRVLAQVGESLKQTFHEGELIGRIGGDEFCVFFRELPALPTLGKKCRQLGRLASLGLGSVSMTFSMGLAFLHPGMSYDELFSMADAALYTSKKQGGDRMTMAPRGVPQIGLSQEKL